MGNCCSADTPTNIQQRAASKAPTHAVTGTDNECMEHQQGRGDVKYPLGSNNSASSETMTKQLGGDANDINDKASSFYSFGSKSELPTTRANEVNNKECMYPVEDDGNYYRDDEGPSMLDAEFYTARSSLHDDRKSSLSIGLHSRPCGATDIVIINNNNNNIDTKDAAADITSEMFMSCRSLRGPAPSSSRTNAVTSMNDRISLYPVQLPVPHCPGRPTDAISDTMFMSCRSVPRFTPVPKDSRTTAMSSVEDDVSCTRSVARSESLAYYSVYSLPMTVASQGGNSFYAHKGGKLTRSVSIMGSSMGSNSMMFKSCASMSDSLSAGMNKTLMGIVLPVPVEEGGEEEEMKFSYATNPGNQVNITSFLNHPLSTSSTLEEPNVQRPTWTLSASLPPNTPPDSIHISRKATYKRTLVNNNNGNNNSNNTAPIPLPIAPLQQRRRGLHRTPGSAAAASPSHSKLNRGLNPNTLRGGYQPTSFASSYSAPAAAMVPAERRSKSFSIPSSSAASHQRELLPFGRGMRTLHAVKTVPFVQSGRQTVLSSTPTEKRSKVADLSSLSFSLERKVSHVNKEGFTLRSPKQQQQQTRSKMRRHNNSVDEEDMHEDVDTKEEGGNEVQNDFNEDMMNTVLGETDANSSISRTKTNGEVICEEDQMETNEINNINNKNSINSSEKTVAKAYLNTLPHDDTEFRSPVDVSDIMIIHVTSQRDESARTEEGDNCEDDDRLTSYVSASELAARSGTPTSMKEKNFQNEGASSFASPLTTTGMFITTSRETVKNSMNDDELSQSSEKVGEDASDISGPLLMA